MAKASTLGLDCRLVHRFSGNTCEMLLVMTPDGERTIIRPQRPIFELPAAPDWLQWDAFYINSSANGAELWAQDAMNHNPNCIVVAQLAKDQRPRPCHVLIASITDMQGRCNQTPWQFAQTIAGNALQHFIVTDGDKGAIVYSAQEQQHVPAVYAEVVDTTGAGDAYAAGVIHGLCHKMPITDAMHEGALWASFAVATQSSIPGDALKNYLL